MLLPSYPVTVRGNEDEPLPLVQFEFADDDSFQEYYRVTVTVATAGGGTMVVKDHKVQSVARVETSQLDVRVASSRGGASITLIGSLDDLNQVFSTSSPSLMVQFLPALNVNLIKLHGSTVELEISIEVCV